VAEEEVERAVRRPPEDSPAFFRGALIRKQAGSRVQLRVSWEGAVIGGRLQGQVIRFRRPGTGPDSGGEGFG
ncbi:MAG: proteasome accessory factor PafA2 family protein, partial [Acidobacteria bacterium]|nr:proteasome accessory factor PafA2 family protein [Acidobacteriota bacterium]